jgi:hypothetical protein
MMVFTLKYLRFPRLAEGFQNPSSGTQNIKTEETCRKAGG